MQYTVEICGENYDFENDCWEGRCLDILDVLHSGTLQIALDFCKSITPLKAMEYEKRSGYNGLSVCVYEHSNENTDRGECLDWVIVASHDWIGACNIESRFKFEYGSLGVFGSYDECDVADTPIEATAACERIEREFSGMPLGIWRYNWRRNYWYAENCNGDIWYMRMVEW